MNTEEKEPVVERKANPITAKFNKRAAMEVFLEQSRKQFFTAAGEPILIPLQAKFEDKLVPVAPFEKLIALKDFYRDVTTFLFYMQNPGYFPGPVTTRSELMFANVARIKYGQWLIAKGYARKAQDEEVTTEVLRDTLKRIAQAQAGDSQVKKS